MTPGIWWFIITHTESEADCDAFMKTIEQIDAWPTSTTCNN